MVQGLCFEKEFPRFLLIAEDKYLCHLYLGTKYDGGTRACVNFKINITNHNYKISI
jgi:hypothetical protein